MNNPQTSSVQATTTSETPFHGSDRSAFSEVYERYSKLLFFIARGFNIPQEEREEIVQECFIRFFESDRAFTMDSAKGFLVVVLRRLFVDRARRRKFRKTEAVGCDIQSIETKLWVSDREHDVALQAIADIVAEISAEPGNAALGMFYCEGRSVREISDRIGEAVGSVTSKLSRLRSRHTERIRAGVTAALESQGLALA